MKFSTLFALSFGCLLSACASHESVCEDITLASEQIQECQALHRQIINAKNQPIIRTELDRRYQQDCVEMRYYRDEHQQAICGNKKNIKEMTKSLDEKSKK